MYVMQEDLARAQLREQLTQAEQSRRRRLALQVEKAQRRAERAERRADRAAAKARLAVARAM
ncbi:hypothetical protein ACIBL3_39530 [Kribbella sp. NPDC050124]|uniref:hypothetical protein n=1 Tax=Kribbella sp. NPDC050124 TaxID=3364114 RepID=UPI0037A72707